GNRKTQRRSPTLSRLSVDCGPWTVDTGGPLLTVDCSPPLFTVHFPVDCSLLRRPYEVIPPPWVVRSPRGSSTERPPSREASPPGDPDPRRTAGAGRAARRAD